MATKMAVNISGRISTTIGFMDNETLMAYTAIWDAQTRLMPAICGLGFATNFLSLLVFLQANLRRLSCSVYLAAKAVSDFLFLLTVFIIWLSRLEVDVFHTTGICQIVVFFSYLTAFISVWLTVTLTVENLLCVIKPWYVQRTCNQYSAAIITTVIVVLGISLYHFSLWSNGVRLIYTDEDSPGNVTGVVKTSDSMTRKPFNVSVAFTAAQSSNYQRGLHEPDAVTTNNTQGHGSSVLIDLSDTQAVKMCMQLEEFTHFIEATTYIDSLLTLFIPLLILAVTNSVIVALAVRISRRRRRLNQHKQLYRLPGTYLTNPRHSSASLETQASRFLFAVSMTTLLFHLPSHVVRLKSMVFSLTSMNILLQRVFETLYYTHYAIGFFVYLIFGINFRKVFFGLVKRHV